MTSRAPILPVLLLGLLPGLLASPAAAQSELVNLRPIDRATVRIVSLHGLGISVGPGRTTRVPRVAAEPRSRHGSGVALGPRLVLTARHVVWGAEAWVVFAPGESTPIVARPVYVDPDQDLAFLAVDQPLEHHVPLPTQRRLTLSEGVSVSGYPLDVREPIPAAASGEVSRVTRNGELHLTMTVNPGHSGGPVIDAQGHVVGILSARGRLEQGVEGLAVAVPVTAIREAHGRIPGERPRFGATDRDVAHAIAWLANVEDRPLVDDRAAIDALVRRAVGWEQIDADRDAFVAGLAWNTLLELLEERGASSIRELEPADRATGEALRSGAQRLARRALSHGPHVRHRFPIVRAISLGRIQPGAPSGPRR
ncbi:MAG TPA: serine protease [Sandaracinaceae bacterium LLY-WYZ-13_1]|nr:serine protease [Sandaracinaceae bacterium LLY-WYZ-13_1]